MDRRVFIAGGLAAVAAAPGPAAAQAGWWLLGSKSVSWGMSRDTLLVTRNRQPVNALSFRTRGGELFLTNIEVFFGRGAPERFPMRARIRPNIRSHIIHLRTVDRPVTRIEFNYSKPRRRVATTLELYGRSA